MGRPRKAKDKPINGEVIKPDFEHARSIHRNDIAPANKAQKAAMQEASTGWKAVKNDAHVHVGGFRTAAKVADMEEADQQAWLRSFRGGLDSFKVALHRDLVDQAEGGDGANDMPVVPLGDAPGIELPTLN